MFFNIIHVLNDLKQQETREGPTINISTLKAVLSQVNVLRFRWQAFGVLYSIVCTFLYV